ncbi:MAG: hypothetical protein WBB82_08140 [Limnothrix sp.]
MIAAAFGLGFSTVLFGHQQVAQAQVQENLSRRPAITSDEDRVFVSTLIKSSLIALNQANQTNNYSVLRSLGSPAFQSNNTSDDLMTVFAGVRNAKLDFSAVVEYEPIFVLEPVLDGFNNLSVQGYFLTNPKIEFELLYQLVNGEFRIDLLTIGIVPTSPE